MSTFLVHCTAEGYNECTSDASPIRGVIYLEIDGIIYPQERWTDFVGVVLGWWISNACNLSLNATVDNLFMDGDYGFSLNRQQKATYLTLTGVSHRPIQVDWNQYLDELLRSGERLASEFHSLGLDDTSDAASLRIGLKQLRTVCGHEE